MQLDIDLILTKAQERLGTNGKVIYLSLSGSYLFGLNTADSDIDVKGIFLPSTIDTCAFKPTHIDLSTNQSTSSNSNEDIDIGLISIHKYFDLLKVGDTNAYDLLFSMFQDNTILYRTKELEVLKEFYHELLSSNSKAFFGYVVAQTKKYGVKGSRYKSLVNVLKELNTFIINNNIDINKDTISKFIKFIIPKNLTDVKLLDKKSSGRVGDGVYLKILDKEYSETIKFNYFLERLNIRLKNYGNRSEKASKGIDYKSLSHALRIIIEFEEIAETHFLKFPLTKYKEILKVKQGDLSDYNNDYKVILNSLDERVMKIKHKILDCGLPNSISPKTFNTILIRLLSTICK